MFRSVFVIFIILFAPASFAAGSHDHSHSHAHESSVGEPIGVVPDRVVEVVMRDTMRFVFEPELDALTDGEVVAFVIRNEGQIPHEFSIGNAEEQTRHAEMMRKMPNMKHADPNAVTLDPGEIGVIKWRFLGDDTVVFACNIAGHFEAGMVHRVEIEEDAS